MALRGYFRQDGYFASIDALALLSAAARAESGTGPVVELADRGTLRLRLEVVGAPGGVATLDVAVETSFDGATEWRALGAFARATAPGAERKAFGGCDRFVRATYTLGGVAPAARVGPVTATGAAPLVVTLTGTPTSSDAFHVRLEVTTAGSRAAMRFRYSLDGGATYIENVSGAANVALGTSGLSAGFPAGAYATDQVYEADVAALATFAFALAGEAV
jgi:hypothetical protein